MVGITTKLNIFDIILLRCASYWQPTKKLLFRFPLRSFWIREQRFVTSFYFVHVDSVFDKIIQAYFVRY